jgi:hypothetical protein
MITCRNGVHPCGSRLRRNRGEVEGGGHQGAGVGVLGGGHQAVGGAGLHDLGVLHDQDLVRQCAHDPQVVADEEIAEAVAGLQFAQQFCACADMSSAEVGSSSLR